MKLDLPPPLELVYKTSTTSTNDDALQLGKNGAVHGTLVVAGEMRGGRGQHGKTWVAPAGNVYWSVLLRPDGVNRADCATLGLVAADVVAGAVRAFLPAATVQVKWPNDVLVARDAGGALHKISGVLLETGGDDVAPYVVVGIGVNVGVVPVGVVGAKYPPTSLVAMGASVAVGAVVERLSADFMAGYAQWVAEVNTAGG